MMTCFLTICVWAADTFLPGTEDIPLMPELSVDITDNMDFDTPAGQIITLEGSSSKVKASDVYSFYQSVLPKMGWKQVKKGYFKRDKDTLRIIIIQPQKPVLVRFEISLTSHF